MPEGQPNSQTIASEKYQKKAGYKVKGFKLKGDIADRFAEACEARGESQASVIARLMEAYIDGHIIEYAPDEKEKVGKITNPKMQTQDRPMGKPNGTDPTAHILTAREIAEFRRKREAMEKKQGK